MPIPTVWIVTRRPKKAFIGVAGGLKGAEDLATLDAQKVARKEKIPSDSITVWSEHGEAPEPGKKFTRASVHVASRAKADWTLTYDCVVTTIYQRPTPKKGKAEPVEEPEPEPAHVHA